MAILTMISISGCTQHTWSPGPGMNLADFEPAKAGCSLVARNGGSGLVVYGRPAFVAGAALGHAIGESIRAQANFNDCMSAQGWRITTPETIAGNKAKMDVIKAAVEASGSCVTAIRDHGTYAAIQQYFGDVKTGKHSMAQLAMSRYATPAEAQMLTSYYDEISPCLDRRQAVFEQVTSEGATIFREARAVAKAEALRVIKHEQTWSTQFIHSDQAIDDLAVRSKAIRL